jgi:hypothetical protein
MPRLSAAFRYMFTAFLTSVFYLAIAYFVLRPLEWREHLFNLLSQAFGMFTALQSSNTLGWVLNTIVSSSFTIILTLLLVGVIRGKSAMKQHSLETAAIALLALFGQIVAIYGPIYLHSVVRTVYEDHQSLVAKANALKPPCPTCNQCLDVNAATAPLKAQLLQQERDLSACMSLQKNIPEIDSYEIASRMTKPDTPMMEYILTTSTTRVLDLTVACDFSVNDSSTEFLTPTGGSIMQGYQYLPITDKQFRIYMQSPEWHHSSPLLISIYFKKPVDRMPLCRFPTQ